MSDLAATLVGDHRPTADDPEVWLTVRIADPDSEERFELPSALRKLIISRDRLPPGSPEPELDPGRSSRRSRPGS